MSLNIIQRKNGLKEAVGCLLLFVLGFHLCWYIENIRTNRLTDNLTNGCQPHLMDPEGRKRSNARKSHLSDKNPGTHDSTSTLVLVQQAGLFRKGKFKPRISYFFNGCPGHQRPEGKSVLRSSGTGLAVQAEHSLFLPIYIIRCSNFFIRKHKDKITFDLETSGGLAVVSNDSIILSVPTLVITPKISAASSVKTQTLPPKNKSTTNPHRNSNRITHVGLPVCEEPT